MTLLLDDLERFDATIDDLISAQDAMLQAEAEQDLASIAASTRFALVAIPLELTVVGLTALLGTWLLHRVIVRPVRDLAAVALAIGNGRLDQPIATGGMDEVGTLQRAFCQMVANLRARDAVIDAQMEETSVALAELELRSAEQARLVAAMEQQGEVIRGLSVPVLPISADALVIPLVGSLDAERLRMVQQQALRAIERSRARTLLLDVTGVPVIDLEVARGLLEVVHMARMLGTRIFLVGIRPEVAQSMVGLDMPFELIKSFSSLQDGIDEALRYGQRAPRPPMRSQLVRQGS